MKKVILFIFILIIFVLAGAYFARNLIVVRAIEKGTTYALGVNANVGSANLALGAGSLELSDYKIDNPSGYESDELLTIKSGVLTVSYGSVFSNTVVVDSMILDGVKVNLIQRGDKGNFAEIINYARKIEFDTSSSTTLVRINKVAVRNISVNAAFTILSQVNIDKSFAIEDITLTNVGGEEGATIAEIASIVFQEILNKAVIKGKGQVSDQFGRGVDNL